MKSQSYDHGPTLLTECLLKQGANLNFKVDDQNSSFHGDENLCVVNHFRLSVSSNIDEFMTLSYDADYSSAH